jgi:hypothetical protein
VMPKTTMETPGKARFTQRLATQWHVAKNYICYLVQVG